MNTLAIDVGPMAYPLNIRPSRNKLKGLMMRDGKKLISENMEGLTPEQMLKLKQMMIEIIFKVTVSSEDIQKHNFKDILRSLLQTETG